MVKPVYPQLNKSHPLAVGLRGCWLLHENAGQTISDISGNNNTGAFDDVARLQWEAGAYGASVRHSAYASGTKYIAVPDNDSLDLGYEMTLIAIVCFYGDVLDWLNIVQKDAATDAARPFDFYRDKNNKRLSLRVFNQLATSNLATAAIALNTWYHVAVTFKSGTTAKFYKDGAAVGTAGPWTLGAPMANTYPVYLSKLSNGAIAGAWIYDRVLSPQEIAIHAFDPFVMARPQHRLWKPAAAAAGMFLPQLLQSGEYGGY
jgi:hypothetical protein